MNIDYLIKNGTIIDGSGDARYEADLLVNGDRIISIFKKDQKSVKIHDENYKLKKALKMLWRQIIKNIFLNFFQIKECKR